MAAATPPPLEFGISAPDFSLQGTNGKTYSLADIRGQKGTVIVFICNHCPYVKAITERLVSAAETLRKIDVSFIAICSNDSENYPEDSFDNMRIFARDNGFSFPYLHDKTQQVAQDYGAVCTPDFFGYNADLELVYRGRLDAGRIDPPPPGSPSELVDAMRYVAEAGKAPGNQIPSIGCSIKWKVA